MDVTIRDQDGKIIGSGNTTNACRDRLAELLVAVGESDSAEDASDSLDTLNGSICPVVFDVEADDADFYEVSVGGRGEVTFTRDELADKDWTVVCSRSGARSGQRERLKPAGGGPRTSQSR